MKWKSMARTVLFLKSLFAVSEVPLNAEGKEVAFSEDQEKLLASSFTPQQVEDMKKAMNAEIAQMTGNNLELKAAQDEIAAMVKKLDLTEKEQEALAEGKTDDAQMLAALKLIDQKQTELVANVQKLVNEGVGDTGATIERTNPSMKVVHSATHLFASNKLYDAIDRPWNKKAILKSNGVLEVGATDFSDQPTVQKLNDDLALFYRENPTALKSLTRDSYGLPSFWPTRTKVDDKVADGNIATAEISQARKLPWLPKNKQTITAEEGQIFPINIDIEYVGYFLQKIEASWLNMLNKEGSQPYKDSFVRFLVGEIDRKARIEDRIATIKGIFVATPEDATEAGRFINRQNGLLWLLYQAREVTQKYRAFDLGLPTATNIVEYVDNMIKSLPLEVRESQGLVYYLSTEHLQAYKRRSETLYGLNNDYSGYPETPKDYPNVKFERLVDVAGSDFHFITFDDNIEILENVPAEKSMYKFEYLKRMIFIWADYKMGVRLIHIGNKVDANDPDEFKVQTVWSNTAPIFPKDTFVPFHENGSTKLKLSYNNVYVTKGRTSTVTDIENFAEYKGQVVRIKGNTGLAGTTNVVHATGKIKLASNANFDLKSGGTLTLFVPADGTVPFELSRTAAPETAPVLDVQLSGAVVDAGLGDTFKSTHSVTTAITSVLNGVEGKTISIYGTDAAGVNVTLSTTGNIAMVSGATISGSTKYVQLTLVDGIWRETKRAIA